jgi:Fur family peroxide stress response transcriptional regulator
MEKKQNYSKKREAILEAVRSTDTHPTAEWVYQKLKAGYPDLSLGTVYRNLSAFKEQGVIMSVGVVGGREHYDGNTSPHTHFICSRCGAVLDVPGNFVSKTQVEKTASDCGFKVTSSEVMLRGICGECLKKEKY